MSLLTSLNHLADQVTALVEDLPCDEPHSNCCSSAPALANFALLLAKGDANKYAQLIETLYQDNGLSPPHFSRYLEQPILEFMVDPFEDDISFMTELDEYQQHEYSQTAFTEEYYALCPLDTKDFEDWFDSDSSGESLLNDTSYSEDSLGEDGYDGPLHNIREIEHISCLSTSSPMPDLRRRFSLLRHSNLLFDLTIDSVPEEVIDNVIQQAEKLNQDDSSVNDCNISLSNYHIINDSLLEDVIDNVIQQTENHNQEYSVVNDSNISLSNFNIINEPLECDMNSTPEMPQISWIPAAPAHPKAVSIFGRASHLCIADEYLDMTPRPKTRPAARIRPPTSVRTTNKITIDKIHTFPPKSDSKYLSSAPVITTPTKMSRLPADYNCLKPVKSRPPHKNNRKMMTDNPYDSEITCYQNKLDGVQKCGSDMNIAKSSHRCLFGNDCPDPSNRSK